nr:hypothetical protein [Actinomycetota bacterium]
LERPALHPLTGCERRPSRAALEARFGPLRDGVVSLERFRADDTAGFEETERVDAEGKLVLELRR